VGAKANAQTTGKVRVLGSDYWHKETVKKPCRIRWPSPHVQRRLRRLARLLATVGVARTRTTVYLCGSARACLLLHTALPTMRVFMKNFEVARQIFHRISEWVITNKKT
jgi:hypothetical protein